MRNTQQIFLCVDGPMKGHHIFCSVVRKGFTIDAGDEEKHVHYYTAMSDEMAVYDKTIKRGEKHKYVQ